MAVEIEVADISGVDEEIRGAYVEKDGKFILDPDRYHELRAAPLIAKNKELLSEKKKLAEAKQEVERLKKGAETDVEKIAAEKDDRITQLERQVREYSIWAPVQEMALKHGAKADSLEALTTLLRVQGRFDLEDGKLVYKDRDGYVTTTKPARAFETYLREEFPWAFEASKAAGSGAHNGSRGGGQRTVSREAFDAMTPAQRDKALAEGVRFQD